MSVDLRTTYNDWLMRAMDAVQNQDKAAAMFCLGHAMRCANKVVGNGEYRRKVLRAMNYVRAI